MTAKAKRAGAAVYHGERFLVARWPDGKRLEVRHDKPTKRKA